MGKPLYFARLLINVRQLWEIMRHASLSGFLAELQDHGELVRIGVPVDSALELAAITDRVAKSASDGGPALLFESVKNSTIPVVTNLLGNRHRLCRCLGVTALDDISNDLDQRLLAEQPSGWLDSFKLGAGWGGLGKWAPKIVKTAACQQVVRLGRDVNLWDLPVPRSWPEEQYPVLTCGQLVMQHPNTGVRHIFQSPLAVLNQQQLALYDEKYAQNSIVKLAAESKQNLNVAISLGGDPLLTLASALSPIVDTRLFAGLVRGAGLEVVRCRTSELDVPSEAEFVIEGYIDFANPRTPTDVSIGRGNGRYVHREMPLIQVTAITHRANPVLPAMIVSKPLSEESWIGLAVERMMLPIVKRQLPEVVDFHRPFCAAGRSLLFVSIHKTADFQARRVLHALWGMESIGQSKIIVIVDADQDVQREEQVWFAVGTNACPSRDFVFADGLARDDDYTTLSESRASLVGIDATRKRFSESSQPWPQSIAVSEDIAARVGARWSEYGLQQIVKG